MTTLKNRPCDAARTRQKRHRQSPQGATLFFLQRPSLGSFSDVGGDDLKDPAGDPSEVGLGEVGSDLDQMCLR